MPEHVWTVLCYKASIDKDSNEVSLLSVVENVSIIESEERLRAQPGPDPAQVYFPMELMSYWVRSNPDTPETGIGRLGIQVPNGEILDWKEIPLSLEEKTGWRIRIRLNGIPLKGEGIYRFVIQQKNEPALEEPWRTVARIPLRLTFKPEGTG